MPPKKKTKSDHKQQSLTSLFTKSQESDPPTQCDLLTCKNAQNNEKSSAISIAVDSAPANSKSREFKSHWLKLFSRLTYFVYFVEGFQLDSSLKNFPLPVQNTMVAI